MLVHLGFQPAQELSQVGVLGPQAAPIVGKVGRYKNCPTSYRDASDCNMLGHAGEGLKIILDL